jgi:hypothetical protein
MILTVCLATLFIGCVVSEYFTYLAEKERAKHRVKIIEKISFKSWYAVTIRLEGFRADIDPPTVSSDYIYLIQANNETDANEEAKYLAAKQCNKTNREMNKLMWTVFGVLATDKINALENGAFFNINGVT